MLLSRAVADKPVFKKMSLVKVLETFSLWFSFPACLLSPGSFDSIQARTWPTHSPQRQTCRQPNVAYLLTKLKKELHLKFSPKYGSFCIFNEWLLMYFQKLLKALISPLNLNTFKDFKDLTNNNTSAIEIDPNIQQSWTQINKCLSDKFHSC